MRIVQAVLAEHGAMYPLLDLIESTAPAAELEALKTQANCLRATLCSHADLEEALLQPAILQHLPRPTVGPDGKVAPTDHDVIKEGLLHVLKVASAEEARQMLLDTLSKTRKHFRKEETFIFPLAERELSDHLQEELGAEWARRRGVVVGCWLARDQPDHRARKRNARRPTSTAMPLNPAA